MNHFVLPFGESQASDGVGRGFLRVYEHSRSCRQNVLKTRNTRGMVSYTFVSHQSMVIRYQFHLE